MTTTFLRRWTHPPLKTSAAVLAVLVDRGELTAKAIREVIIERSRGAWAPHLPSVSKAISELKDSGLVSVVIVNRGGSSPAGTFVATADGESVHEASQQLAVDVLRLGEEGEQR